jgi:anaerobic magnesium-protoporphyrin IX monomethyl ester cyclase
MRVLLLSPPQKNVYGRLGPPYPPLGLLQIGACLKKDGHDVRFVDAALYPREVEPALMETRPDLVCITSVTPTYPGALELAETSRNVCRAAIAMGGPHVSILPQEPLKMGMVDFAVVGEGEETVTELVAALEGGDPARVRGVWSVEEGSPQYAGEREPIKNLDLLPFPDWGLIREITAYAPPEALASRVFTIIASRGCPFDCSFCVSGRLFGRRIRRRSVRSVIDEIEVLVRERGAEEIHFADDCFTSDRRWVLNFCTEIRAAGLKMPLSFMNGLRADQVDGEVLGALKMAGARTLGFGVETGDRLLMEQTGKNLSLEDVEAAFRMSKEVGFNTWGFFIVGFPGETQEQARSTLDLSLKLDPDFAKFFPLVPFPGTRLFEMMEREGMLREPEWSEYNLYSKNVPTMSAMSSVQISRILSHFYRRFYLRPGKLLSRVSRIRSLRELWLNLRMVAFLIERFTSV